jgi:hypothetical protein
MEAFITGLGLSTSAGLNAWLPLVVLGLAQQSDTIQLEGQFAEGITSIPALIVFSILLLIEMTVDKVPGVDSVNDVLNTAIRPAAGIALMFATTSGMETSVDPEFLLILSMIAGGASAGGVHTTKAVARPAITVSTAGLGNAIVSVIEDIISLIMSLFALVLPVIIVFFVLSFIVILPWWFWERRRLSWLRYQGYLQ